MGGIAPAGHDVTDEVVRNADGLRVGKELQRIP